MGRPLVNDARLRISRSHFPVTALGPGLRLGVWGQGCPLACSGCMPRGTRDPDGGVEVGAADLERRWRDTMDRGATGLTVSGGELLAQAGAFRRFLKSVRRVGSEFGGDLDVLISTGYKLGEIDADRVEAVDLADAVIMGCYDAASPTDPLWRGSANQSLLIRSDSGRRRYAEWEDRRAARPPWQMRVDGTGVWFAGIPPRGALARVDRAVRSTGLAFRSVSWRSGSSGL
ncbi:putative radical activating enzyme [Catenulispora acidiphila DSM 44928]|uniref:Putative radical activating enzyme n=1 Tax=Catenulispora acidiphila (strain DSM 44928 / JCM 14897 / NBRC 102108 / NRRL B-24433 / ID139908) TaxID=479433 RepID=C7Q3M1_CATAD|nr:4Fe-4S single cluster domain-containing protein [Catenulispora acidiphila]ACU75786.1 putative radical activating enzyme [Catenulispora acidiphila DSM 44928]